MRSMTYLGAALLAISLGATSALANEATNSACREQGKKVTDALAANKQSPQYDAAFREARDARDFCNNGHYQMSLDHYANVLKELGVSAG